LCSLYDLHSFDSLEIRSKTLCMSSIFREYNAKSVFIPATLITVLAIVSLIILFVRQNGLFQSGPYSLLLVIAGGTLALSSFFVAYNACFLQFARFKNFGFVFGVILFGLALYYLYAGLWEVTSKLSIYQTLYDYFYASVAILLLTALSEFHRLFKYVIILNVLLLISALITSRSLLTPDLVEQAPFLSRFTDLSFWNLVGIVIAGVSLLLLFLTSNLVLEKFRSKSQS
jgi:hypothetical protein